MTKLEDLRWIASQVDDLAVLLRVYGMEELADQFDAARDSLCTACTGQAPGNERVVA